MGSAVVDDHPFEGMRDAQLETGSTLQALYLKDLHPDKVNLLRGAYQAESTPFIPPSTILAREKLVRDPTWHHDYLPFLGAPGFLSAGEELFFGSQSNAIMSQLIASMQTVGATGAIHIGGRFLKEHYDHWKEPSDQKLYLATDTWVNHRNIFKALSIELVNLPYYDPSRKALDWDGFTGAIAALPPRSVVLLQTAAHNPTGCDPTTEQWHELTQVFLSRRHLAFLDSAYLGLVSGNPDTDAATIRIFEAAGVPLLLAGTFGKSFGLYGERVGMLSFIAPNRKVKEKMQKQMMLLARSETGSSPAFGAKIVETILGDKEIRAVWEEDVKGIAANLRWRRHALRDELQLLGTPGEWEFITRQVGMFSYFDFTPSQLEFLRTENHIYIDRNTRLSFAAISADSIKLLARGIDNMIRNNRLEM